MCNIDHSKRIEVWIGLDNVNYFLVTAQVELVKVLGFRSRGMGIQQEAFKMWVEQFYQKFWGSLLESFCICIKYVSQIMYSGAL